MTDWTYGDNAYGDGPYGGLLPVVYRGSWADTHPSWIWAVGRWGGLPDKELREVTSRSLKISLLDQSTATVTLNGDSDEALYINDLVTDLKIWRNGVPLYLGRVVGTGDDIQETTYALSVSTVDYRGLLARRILWADITFTAQTVDTIIWSLISTTQDKSGGDLGITKGLWPTGPIATVTFKDGDTVWACLQTLLSYGVEFTINTDLVMDLYVPQFGGINRGAILDYGGTVTKAAGDTKHDQYANAFRQSGASGVATTDREAADISSREEGRWELALADTSLTTTAMVGTAADANLVTYADLQTSWTLTLAPGKWGGPAHVWIGDVITYAIKRGRRNDVRQVRVYEINISVDANDEETVSIVVGREHDNDTRLLQRTIRRVAYLSKE